MILHFPDLATLHLALSRGLIPSEIASRPVLAGRATDGFGLSFTGRILKKSLDALAEMGVAKADTIADTKQLSNWYEAFPLTPTAFEVPRDALFVVDSAKLADVVNELLRLGSDRAGLANLADGRTLLKVTSPPYYTLLAAQDGAFETYVETAPRVWLEAGFTHPFAARVTPPEDQFLFVSRSQWKPLSVPAFEDFYQSLRFTAPLVSPHDAAPPQSIHVPLRLANGNSSEPASLWVTNVETIQQFVEEADSQLITQLSFAVSDRVCVLRAKPGQSLIVQLDDAYAPFWRLPNLFLPLGQRLHPPIRRDVAARLLADDPTKIVWIDRAFARHTIDDNAFRPLMDWVEYVVDAESEALSAWMDSTTFDFEKFVIADGPAPVRTPEIKSAKPSIAVITSPALSQAESAGISPAIVEPLRTPESREPGEWQIRTAELEKQFLALGGSLDSSERLPLWAKLTEANAALGPDRKHETALSAAFASDTASQQIWFANEWPAFDEAAFSELLAKAEPTPAEVRAAAAAMIVREPASLAACQRFAEAHDHHLPVRLAWDLAVRLANLAKDPLGLARGRDRLLLRLFERGLQPEHDLPAFLRFAGIANSEETRLVRDRFPEVHAAVRRFTAACPSAQSTTRTQSYIDLLFAWGYAVLGEQSQSRGLVEQARRTLEAPEGLDDLSLAGTVLFRGFAYRIEEAFATRPLSGPLPANLLATLADYGTMKAGVVNSPYANAEYAINRLREQSLILDPLERPDPYAETKKAHTPLTKLLADLPRMSDLARKVREAYRDGFRDIPTAESRVRLLTEALPLAPRAGTDFTLELLALVPPTVKDSMKEFPAKSEAMLLPVKLLGRAVSLAVFFDRPMMIAGFADLFFESVHTTAIERRDECVALGAGPFLLAFRKLSLRDSLDGFVRQLLAVPLGERSDEMTHRAKLQIAAGWLALDAVSSAMPLLDAARATLAEPSLPAKSLTAIAQAYLAALGFGPAALAIERIGELFEKLDPKRVTNTLTTAPHYSRYHLNLAEAVVLALVSDDSRAGRESRHWLDADELLIRRRIHAAVAHLEAS